MGKLRMRSWHQSITRPEVKPGSFQTGRFASPVPSSLFNSLPWQAPLISSTSSLLSSYPSPHQSSQGDACKTETRAYHSAAQNSSPSLLPNLLPAVSAHMPTLARCQVPITPTHSAPPTLLPPSPSSSQSSFLPQDLCICSAFCQKCFVLLRTAYFQLSVKEVHFQRAFSWLFSVKGPHDLH